MIQVFFLALLGIGFLSAKSAQAEPGYPAHWWKPVVPRSSAPRWEILPQDAGPGEVILSKRNELGIFSNFAATPFSKDGVCYASVEGFWQMLKYPEGPQDPRWRWTSQWPYTRAQVASLTGLEAKRAGEFANELLKKNNADWVTYQGRRLQIWTRDRDLFENLIRHALLEKLRQNPPVLEILMKTGNLRLKPDHEIAWTAGKAWKYHVLWMEIREELRRGRRLPAQPWVNCRSTPQSRVSGPARDPRG